MKDHESYLRELRRRRYIIVRRPRSGHLRVYCQHGNLVATHSLNGGSDKRSLKNFQADIRRNVCLACKQQGEHVQGQPSRDERSPDRPRGHHPGDDTGHGEQQERDQDQETMHAAHGESASQNHDGTLPS